MKKQASTSLVLILVLLALTRQALAQPMDFTDVTSQDWFYEDLELLQGQGGIQGYPDGSFRPQDSISFGEFLKLSLASVKKKDYQAQPGYHWAREAYMDAVVDAIIDSTNFSYSEERLNSPLTREDMAYIIIGIDENLLEGPALEGEPRPIGDREEIDPIKESSVDQAYLKGLLTGRPQGFQPLAPTTRAEATTVIVRLLDPSRRIGGSLERD